MSDHLVLLVEDNELNRDMLVDGSSEPDIVSPPQVMARRRSRP